MQVPQIMVGEQRTELREEAVFDDARVARQVSLEEFFWHDERLPRMSARTLTQPQGPYQRPCHRS